MVSRMQGRSAEWIDLRPRPLLEAGQWLGREQGQINPETPKAFRREGGGSGDIVVNPSLKSDRD
jgi:hypothetical protein